ncbi:MAG: hypothetical protein L3J91_03630, partial [Thermoplasmata archaeon]|nr:hypothetical protein [Thermoplasmata archaeon]
ALFWSERLTADPARKTFLVLDEAQWYAHDSVAEMLRLGRRANLHLWLATQSLDALAEGVRAAVETNVADFIVFRGSPSDARDLARMTPAIRPETLWSLPPGHAVALVGKGEQVVQVRIDAPPRRTNDHTEDRLRAVRDGSARFRPEEASVPPPIDRAATPASPGEPLERPGPPVVRPLLLAIWSELLEAEAGAAARFYLEELRRVFDPDGREVRALGHRLREVGALARSDRDDLGAYWELHRSGFGLLLGPGVDPEALEAAARQWRRRDRSGLGARAE